MMKKFISFLLIPLFAVACNQVPDGVLNRKKMENVLYEVHIAEGIMEEYPLKYRSAESKQKLLATVFQDNGITKAEFDSSMVYYGAHLDQYMKIYQKVTERLNQQKELASAQLLAYERSLLTPEGDSVNIWKHPAQRIIDPALLAATAIFEIKGDSNFRADDRLIWKMRFDNLPPDSLAYLYVALGVSAKDTTIQTAASSIGNGWFSLELTAPLLGDKDKIFGSVSLINRRDTLLTPVYIDRISLMRYRAQIKEVAIPDSLKIDSLSSNPIHIDSLKTDSIK